jgi:hypothetical protein
MDQVNHSTQKDCLTTLPQTRDMTAILPICKPTSRVKIWEGKQSRIHYFMHYVNSKYSEKQRIGTIDQGFTCLVV